MCDRVVVLYRGQVMETGPAREVAASPAHPYTHALHEAAPLPDPRAQRARRALHARPASSAGQQAAARGCPFASRCPHVRQRCHDERPQLRPSRDGGLVACHRFPEWRGEPVALSTTRTELDGHAG
jgi:oligopeptide/dipeptide ABC transporter ATP-binding protein